MLQPSNNKIWSDKNTAFSRTLHFEFNGKSINKKGPLLMGIINITPDSFYSGSRYQDESTVLQQAELMLSAGADILDLGAFSTRPGAKQVSTKEELDRLIPKITSLLMNFPNAFISVDSFRVAVAEAALNAGASMINDISGGLFDNDMAEFIGQANVPYVMMHIHGKPQTMQVNPLQNYEVLEEVRRFFMKQVENFEKHNAHQLILDPGFGFGKTYPANYRLLSAMNDIRINNYPTLAGVSRKSMIYNVLDIKPEDALNGTSIVNSFALLSGADILRVHDVQAAQESIALCKMFLENQND